LLGFNYKKETHPNNYYQVYLDDKVLGVIKSKKELEDYINKRGENIKRKYDVDRIYAPNGLEVKRIVTYHDRLNTVREIYEMIEKEQPFTIRGYQLTIKNDVKTSKVYATKEVIFKEALENTIKTFVGEQVYNLYSNNSQGSIQGTGTIIENVYVEDNKTIKEINIPVNEKIYTDSNELTKFLVFGTTDNQKTYTVNIGDTIDAVAFNNQISVEEFLISNPQFTNKSNLLFPGQEVVIGITDPQVSIVVEEYAVQDVVSKYKIEERYDPNRLKGDDEITQQGEDGLERIAQRIKVVNGTIVYIDPVSKEELKPTINQIVVRGDKYAPSVGSLNVWSWPTASGWTITSYYGYRIHPLTYKRELHAAIDIAGPGYGSPIYASNHGTIEEAGWHYSYGYYIIINHNNGYYTLYAHMSKLVTKKIDQIVARGTIIGYMGSTGDSTGPHLHYEMWVGKPWSGGYRINPFNKH
jgi:murein DD-endopeptidase MepM/ murein hydrolase activator NlpD